MPAFHADWIWVIPYLFLCLKQLSIGQAYVIRFRKEGKKKEKFFGGGSGEGKRKEMRDSNVK